MVSSPKWSIGGNGEGGAAAPWPARHLADADGSVETAFQGTMRPPGRPTIMKMSRRNLLGAASVGLATTILSRPSSAAAEFEFKLGANTADTHPLTVRLVEAARAISAHARCRTTAGAATGLSPTAAPWPICRPICRNSLVVFSMLWQSRNVPICWSWIARYRPSSSAGYDVQQARSRAIQGGAGKGRLLYAVAEDLWCRSLGAAGAIYRSVDLKAAKSPA